MIYPSKEEFIKKTKEGNLIPVYMDVIADMETPVSAFRKIEKGSDFAFLLESVEGGENMGRYSFLAKDPSIVFKSKDNEVDVFYFKHSNYEDDFSAQTNPLEALRDILKRYKPVIDPNLPPFFGGAVGYIGYNMIRSFEDIPDKNPDDLSLPDCFFMFTDTVLIFDHVMHKIKIVSNAHVMGDPEKAYDEAVNKIERLNQKLKIAKPIKPEKLNGKYKLKYKSNFKKEEFEQAVEKCKEYILAGDIFQVVISQRLKTQLKTDPFNVYRALRIINPSPYMYYLKFGELKIVGSSPEILVKVNNNKVTLRPIAGTRKRGSTPQEDEALIKDLLSDPKELAEHIMLVDLGRNDCGRVSKFGTVKPTDLMVIEKYSHVLHIVSNVEGELDDGKDSFDVLAACFPAGTVTGAPKIRAMEIIDEIENVKRGPYAGVVGYFGYNGSLDSAITIRTIVIKDDTAYVQAGAGIVADSVPEKEYEETLMKATGMLRAIELAERGLDL